MAWERRARGNQQKGYFYLSVRDPVRPYPVKKYLGTGALAEAEAARIVEKRRQQLANKTAIKALEHDPKRL